MIRFKPWHSSSHIFVLLALILQSYHFSIISRVSHSPTPRIAELSIDEIQLLQAEGRLTATDLAQCYLVMIQEVNHVVHAVSELNPDALSIARKLDKERKAGRLRGPLHGIPVLVKDNIATLDSMNNTAGSFALLGASVRHESMVVSNLRNAGAVVLGKATTGEWAQFRSSIPSSSHGWSAYGGQTLGAYYPQQDPSGSCELALVCAPKSLQ